MDLANTEIEIRERTLAQRVDLTFRFLAARWRGILAFAAVGVVPAMLGQLLLLWLLDPEFLWQEIGWGTTWGLVLFLVWTHSPIAMAPLLLYLGAVLFRQPLRLATVLRDIRQRVWRQVWVHGIVRLQLFWFALACLGYAGRETELCWFVIISGLLTSGVFSSLRPYVDHIIYLERLPLRIKAGFPATVRQRSRLLHLAGGSSLTNEAFAALLLSGIVFYATYAIFLWTYYWLTFNTVTQHWFVGTLFAAALWLVMVVTTVFRFLGYLDSRIRAEGWEVELRVKREAQQRTAATARAIRPTSAATASNLTPATTATITTPVVAAKTAAATTPVATAVAPSSQEPVA